jgi:aldehyde:ferredoxin oxidoreductase
MDRLCGWVGKILRVDLTSGAVSEVDTTRYARYVGGIGINARLGWEELAPGTDPFSAENKLLFMTGPLGGIPIVPGAGRACVCGISPHTHPKPVFTYSNMGGDWPVELKFAGYDGLIVQGSSDRPVWLWIHDGKVELKDATSLWGLDTYETQKRIAAEVGDPDVRTVCIGPAGENRVRFASIQSDTGSAFGQGGFGAVMGSKNLKAISARGTGEVAVADPGEVVRIAKYANSIVFGNAAPRAFQGQAGPLGKLWGMNSGIALANAGYGLHSEACRGCGQGCRGYFRLPGMGGGQGVCVQWFYGIARDPENDGTTRGDKATWLAKTLGDSLGVDLVELGGMLFFLRDALKESIITERDLPMPTFLGGKSDDETFISEWIHGIAFRKGFGEVLAEGTARAAERLGERAWHIYERYFMAHGMHTHWCGSVLACLQWAMDTRDPFNSGHDYCYGMGNPVAAKFAWGTEAAADPESYGHVPQTLRIIQHSKAYKDMLILCDFAFPIISTPYTANGLGDMEMPVKIFEPTTGVDIGEKGLRSAAEAVVNVLRAIMVRDGRTREDDTVYPSKFDKAFYYNGLARMFKMFGPLDRDRWENMKDAFYQERGWDTKTGWPTEEKLKELDLQDVAEELGRLGKLP